MADVAKTSTPAAATAPRTAAVIDVGSTAIRMEIAELNAETGIRKLESLQQPVQLGKDTFTLGRIQHATMEECVRILKGYRRVMEEYGITTPEQIHAIATSSVREAINREMFLDRLYMATTINVKTIDEAEETRLTYMAVQNILQREPELKHRDVLVIEIGGGVTGVLLIQDGYVTYSNTYRLGTLRIREIMGGQQMASPQRALGTLLKQIQLSVDQIRRSVPITRVPHIIALASEAHLAADQLALNWKQSEVVRVDPRLFSTFARKVAVQTPDELVRAYRLNYAEAETVGTSLLAFSQLVRAFHTDDILIPKANLRHGLLQEAMSSGIWTSEFLEQVEHSAITLGGKYGFDEKHARQVASLSSSLYRALQSEHMLPPRFELMLRVAGLLHEIGLFVSNRSYHKHSMYLILNSELFGLSHEDMLKIAMVARYHRRASPQPYHEGFSTMNRDARLAVSKMAAILRVADALDRNRMQQVRTLRCTREEGHLVVWVRDIEDLTLERLALREKGNFFEEVYGMKVIFRTESIIEKADTNV